VKSAHRPAEPAVPRGDPSSPAKPDLLGSDELDAWIALAHRPGLGRDSLRKLLAAFGSPRAVLAAPASALRSVLGPRAAVEAFVASDAEALPRIKAARAWLAAKGNRRVLALGEEDYPDLLLQTADPPLLLYLEGSATALQRPALAIVGSRQATPQGRQNAHDFAREMAGRGWVIVSGLATGIDAAAHEGALHAGGQTIAVVGTGLDQVYPAEHRSLAERIAERGLLVSEYALGTPPRAKNFPQRNRIIATLTRGTLVVEAAVQSGSLITARLAADAGREVFTIPGSIHSPQSRGCHSLLKQGAKLVEKVDDLLEELDHPHPGQGRAGVADDLADATTSADPVLRALGHDPSTLDALMARCGWPAPEINARLLELELAGQVARLPGGLFQRIESA